MSDERVCQVELTVQEARKIQAALTLAQVVSMSLDPESPYEEDTLARRFANAAAIGELEQQLDEYRG